MKILYVISSLEVGGTETQIALLSEEMLSSGCDVALFVKYKKGKEWPLFSQLESKKIEVIWGCDVSTKKHQWLIRQMTSFFRLFWILYNRKYDVVHSYLPAINIMAAFAGRLARTPAIFTSKRALGLDREGKRFRVFCDQVSNKLSHTVVVNSQAVHDVTLRREGIPHQKLKIIYNGVDVSRFHLKPHERQRIREELGLSEKNTGIIAVGNLFRYKGHEDLIRAFALIDDSNTRLIIVGQDRGMLKELQQLAQYLNVNDRLVFAGHRSDVPQILLAMDLFVMPSHQEGFSNALLEAMTAGLPIVATTVGGNAEALANGDCGLLTPPAQEVSLAKAIAYLLRDKELGISLGQKAKNRIMSHYATKNLVQAHLELYQKHMRV